MFTDPPGDFGPVPTRTEPRLWVRRLVVVTERQPESGVIRDVALRRGLNIVRVADRPAGESRVIAHSVGKTLLTRLIRYCLGEQHFATAERTARVSERFPTAYVVAEIRMAGTNWVVARPMKDGRASESFAVEANDWRAGLAPAAELRKYGDFTQAIEQATLAGLPSLTLPQSGHAPRWLDVLAWLSRDAACKYQHPAEWRSPIARSGTARLDLTDASLLTSWLTGVLDPEDITEQQQRRAWASERDAAAAEQARLTRRADAMEAILADRLEVAADELGNELFADRVRSVIADRRTRLEVQRESLLAEQGLGLLQAEMVRTAAAVSIIERDMSQAQAFQREADADIRQLRSGQLSADEFYARFDRRPSCPLNRADCEYRAPERSSVPDGERADRIAEREADYIRHGERVNELSARLSRAKQEADAAGKAYVAGRLARQEAVRPVESDLGRLAEVESQYRDYGRDRRDAETAARKAERLEKRIRESQETERAERSDRELRLNRIASCYDDILKRLVGAHAGGSVVRDARGLHPRPDDATAAGGATLGSLSHVIGFDLACLAATLAGQGSVPPFFVHDSPESIVMESALYDRLLRTVHGLEIAYATDAVGFQYIVTTTAPPPAELSHPPHVVLTLDARDRDGLLLGDWF